MSMSGNVSVRGWEFNHAVGFLMFWQLLVHLLATIRGM